MQLLVPTGRQIAKKSEGYISRRTLQNPDLNVRLGARYLGHVRQVTGAVNTLVPPGYNAGPGALRRWLKNRSKLPLDLFVELIPYKEARDYTKKVNATYGIYHYLYANRDLIYIGQKTRLNKAKRKGRSSSSRKRGRRERR